MCSQFRHGISEKRKQLRDALSYVMNSSPEKSVDMKTRIYDRVASLLIALLLLIGSLVAIMFVLWLSSQILAQPRAVPVTLVPRGDGAGISDTETHDPNVIEPGLEFEDDEPTFLESLESVDNIISDNAALFSEPSPQDDSLLTPGGKIGDGRTKGDGVGLAGRVRRWEIRFDQGITIDQYAKMLDYFKIELGVLKPGGKVVYVSRLSDAKPTVREGDSIAEQRYYLTWLKSGTDDADGMLLDKAGVARQGRLIIKFLPPDLEARLEKMEADYAKNRLSNVKASFFRVQPNGNDYRFNLYYQVY